MTDEYAHIKPPPIYIPNTSPTIGKLAVALSKCQQEMKPAKQDSINPHWKNKYADFNSIRETSQKPLADNGLSFVQLFSEATLPGNLKLTTKLIHSSGEWISSALEIKPATPAIQEIGKTITYMRRYTLSALLGISQGAEADDDGNADLKAREEAEKKRKADLDAEKKKKLEAAKKEKDSPFIPATDVTKFWTKARKLKWEEDEVRLLLANYNIESTKEIGKDFFAAVMEDLDSRDEILALHATK